MQGRTIMVRKTIINKGMDKGTTNMDNRGMDKVLISNTVNMDKGTISTTHKDKRREKTILNTTIMGSMGSRQVMETKEVIEAMGIGTEAIAVAEDLEVMEIEEETGDMETTEAIGEGIEMIGEATEVIEAVIEGVIEEATEEVTEAMEATEEMTVEGMEMIEVMIEAMEAMEAMVVAEVEETEKEGEDITQAPMADRITTIMYAT
jgi:hypothetical protein